MNLDISVTDIVSCRKYMETIPKQALDKGKRIHEMIQEEFIRKYGADVEVEIEYTAATQRLNTLHIHGVVDIIDHENNRVIEIKPWFSQHYHVIQLMIYMDMLLHIDPAYIDYKAHILHYRVRNGKLRLSLSPALNRYEYMNIINDNIEEIEEIALKMKRGEEVRIRPVSCGRCPFRLTCRPNYVWVRLRNGYSLVRYEAYRRMMYG